MEGDTDGEQTTSESKEFSELILPDPCQLQENVSDDFYNEDIVLPQPQLPYSSSDEDEVTETDVLPQVYGELEQVQPLEQQHQQLEQSEEELLHQQQHLQQQQQPHHHHHQYEQQQSAELSSPSLSSVSPKTNNDNGEDNNNSQQEHAMSDGLATQETETPGLGRNRRVRQKNRYFEDFHCMNLKKGGRSKDDYDVYSSSVSATRSSNRRSTTDNSRRDLDAAVAAAAGAGDVDAAATAAATAAGSVHSSELGDFSLRHCNKCYKRTPHDTNRKCQACLYKRVVSDAKRQKTRENRLKAQASRSGENSVDGSSGGGGGGDCGKQDNNNEGEQSLATSASSSVAHTPTPSLDGSSTGSGRNSSNKRKSESQGGRLSKQQPVATATALPTLHDTEDVMPDMILDTQQTPEESTTPTPIISNQDQDYQSAEHSDIKLNNLELSNNTTKNVGAQEQHNTSSGSSGNSDLTGRTNSDSRTSGSAAIASLNNSCSSSNNTTIIKQTTSPPLTPHQQLKQQLQLQQQQSYSALKLTTTLKTDEKGNKRWVVKPNKTTTWSYPENENENDNIIANLTQLDAWTPDEVAQYVLSRGFLRESELFKSQEVDGMSLLLMKRTDFTYGLKMKLGPALKLFDQVCKLKREYFSLTATAS